MGRLVIMYCLIVDHVADFKSYHFIKSWWPWFVTLVLRYYNCKCNLPAISVRKEYLWIGRIQEILRVSNYVRVWVHVCVYMLVCAKKQETKIIHTYIWKMMFGVCCISFFQHHIPAKQTWHSTIYCNVLRS